MQFYRGAATGSMTESMRIDSSGYVGINNQVASTVSGGFTNLVTGSGTASNSGISIYNSTSGVGRIHFADGTTGGDRYDGFIAYIHSDRELLIGAGTGGTHVAFFSQHGFHPNPSDSGSAVAANALDDYEEGTFTPQVGDGTMTFAFVRGHYVKIGRLVHIHIGFRLNGASPTGSDAYISGLPFASETTGSYQEPHARCAVAGNLYNATPDLSFYLSSGSSVLYARDSSTNADTAVASNSIWTSTSFIKLQMCYRTS